MAIDHELGHDEVIDVRHASDTNPASSRPAQPRRTSKSDPENRPIDLYFGESQTRTAHPAAVLSDRKQDGVLLGMSRLTDNGASRAPESTDSGAPGNASIPMEQMSHDDEQNKPRRNTHAGRRPDAPAEPQPGEGPRTLTERGRQTVARILASAIDIFVKEGYGGLSMRKVATSAGLALSNLQHYFPSREDLFAAIITETIATYSRSYDGIRTDATLSPEARLEKVVRLLIEDGKLPRTQSLFVNIQALAHTHEFARKSVEDAYQFQRRVIGAFVSDVNPDLTPLELSRRAALITCQIEGLFVLIPQRNRFPSDIKGIEDEAVKAIVALVRAPGERSAAAKPKAAR
ncbi:TetR/AcrR family transcriptional regulator [Burkholderia stagnalis]|uniref:TetR/AcrR family transcriptional regulator n=1 Tax=Burkholderia stagnalis TaxID=1503054 RepID=UPI0009C06376|nr:TetR/AcrR family transcriptional regulator [Burkholderia stagnalis]